MIFGYCLLDGRTGHQAGWELLEKEYRACTGQAPPPISVTPEGKPYWKDSPWHFSISHTHRHAFCALAKVPVGIDAEELDRPIALTLAERVLSPWEKEQFDQAEDKRRALLTFWVLKEAAAKQSGEGLRIFPNHTSFSLKDPRVWECDGCLVAVLIGETNG